MNTIQAKTSQAYWRRIGLLWAMFGSFGLIMTAMAKEPALGIFGLLVMLAPGWLLYRRRATWMATMDGAGVTLLSGKHLPWAELQKIVDVHALRGGARWHNHYDLIFRGGRARVFDRMLANSDEVLGVIKALEQGYNPLTGLRR
jgi:hypothetical protein